MNNTEYKTILDINLGIADDMLIYSQFGFQKIICITKLLNQVSELISSKFRAERKKVPKPLLEIQFIEKDNDLQEASRVIRQQIVDCVLVDHVIAPEEDTVL